MWDKRKQFISPALLGRTCHAPGSFVSSVTFAYDRKGLASRGGDDSLKSWDMRSLKTPVAEAHDLCNRFPMTNCAFSTISA